MRQFHFHFFTVFSIFWVEFFLNCFPNHFRVCSMSSFLFSQRKFFEMYARTCPAMFFLIRRLNRWFLRPDFLELTFSITLVASTALKLNFLYVTSFLLLGQNLNKKMTSQLSYWTLNFLNIYGLKINSVHLSSAKLIRPNFWVLVLSFRFRASSLKKLF